MKKLFLFFLVFVTAFNLAGGYAIALSFNPVFAQKPIPSAEPFTISAKHTNFFQNQPQLLKEEKQDDDLVKADLSFPAMLPETFKFAPEFKVYSRHFLVYYATAIKAELPALYLLGLVFRL